MKPKIIFFGSDKYSQIVLNSLEKDRRFEIIDDLKNCPDVGVLASYGKILPPEVLAIPKHGILNIHPSLLPKYRGPSPVQTTILNGEKQTGVTIIKIDERVDHGPIVAQSIEKVLSSDTAESLYFRLFKKGAEMLKDILPDYLGGRFKLKAQEHSEATYTKKLNRDDGKIDWKKPTDYLERFVRAMFPWPGAWTLLRPASRQSSAGQAKRLKILAAHLENGKLALDQVQLEGKKPVAYKQFCKGYPEAKIIYQK